MSHKKNITAANLPVEQVLPDILRTLLNHPNMILHAPPGAGKTTLVPIALLDQPWLKNKKIIMLEPRRLAARNAAGRMAFLLGEKVGETVGYQIRSDSCQSSKTKILVVTEGILTRKLQHDPELSGVGLVIFDEFHERNIQADLSLAFCLQAQDLLRDDLKILVMSATLNSQEIAALLNNAPIVASEGRSYPVEIIYASAQAAATNNAHANSYQGLSITNAVLKQLQIIIQQETASVLVFLPGVKEINRLELQLQEYIKNQQIKNIQLSPLHGGLRKQLQDQAISTLVNAQEQAIRKIVLATNIAETSLTIEGVDIVLDAGLQRIAKFDPGSGMSRLQTSFISKDSAQQRAGRAGRLRPGKCFRLWTEDFDRRMSRYSQPEILTTDLAPFMLELAHWGVQHPRELDFIDLPSEASVSQANDLLHQLGAIGLDGKITPHGKKMLALGLHPRLAHMLLKSKSINATYDACLIAGLLTEKDFLQAEGRFSTDISQRIQLLWQIKLNNKIPSERLNKHQARLILKTADDLCSKLKLQVRRSPQVELTGVLLAYAYPDRLAQLRAAQQSGYLLANGKGAFLLNEDYLFGENYLVIADLDGSKRQSRIYKAAIISFEEIEEYFADDILVSCQLNWNKAAQRVDAREKKCLGAITLHEKVAQTVDVNKVEDALLEAIKDIGIGCLPWDDSALQFRQRLIYIKTLQQTDVSFKKILDVIEIPDLSDKALSNSLHEWLKPHLNGRNSIEKLQNLKLSEILKATMSWQTQQAIDELVPLSIKVPSGSMVKIDYSDAKQPVLAVRLQEMFGQLNTPSILNGRVALLLHLLSPARRPMQVTNDLASFWESTYFEVKKELRGKYKRHYWPDDPLQAEATSRAKRTRKR